MFPKEIRCQVSEPERPHIKRTWVSKTYGHTRCWWLGVALYPTIGQGAPSKEAVCWDYLPCLCALELHLYIHREGQGSQNSALTAQENHQGASRA
jgi:hypothetical protein